MINSKEIWPQLIELFPDTPRYVKEMTIRVHFEEPVQVTATYYPEKSEPDEPTHD